MPYEFDPGAVTTLDTVHENTGYLGRPIKLVDGGEVVEELFG